MSIPQNSDAAAEVSKGTLGIIARVQADEETAALVRGPAAKREALKAAMRALVDGDDDRILAAGALSTAQAKTDAALKGFGKKVAAEYADAKPAGEKHPEYRRIFDGKTAASVLPDARAERQTGLDALLGRIAEPGTPAGVKKAASVLQKAASAEKSAAAVLAKAEATHEKLAGRAEEAKIATVVAVRALAGSLQVKFADDPARVKQFLGQGIGGGKKKGSKKPEDPPADPTVA